MNRKQAKASQNIQVAIVIALIMLCFAWIGYIDYTTNLITNL